MTDWPFGDLRPLSYDVILCDPPTRFETRSTKGEAKSPQAQYPTMTWDELAEMPVSQLGRGDTFLMLWACWPTLPQSLGLLDAWGFRYVTGGAWHKKTKHGKTAFGNGYVFRSASEPFLIGALGSPKTATDVRNIIEAEARGHSRKPDEQYALCESIHPLGIQFAELFARQCWPGDGWSAWGNQVDEFEVAT